MLEKRINVSPPEAPISYLDGKLPPHFHVNVVTVVTDSGALVGKQQTHRTAYTAQLDGTFARPKEPDADVEAALAAAEDKTQAMWAELVRHQGVMDHTLEVEDVKLRVSYAPDGSGAFVRSAGVA